jgi:Spy/CpxP family protein refolding chaperone
MEGNRANNKAIGLIVLVFLLGIAIGGLGTHFWGGRIFGGRADHPRIVERLTRELALTPDQRKQLETIIEETRTKFQSIYEQERPLYDQARKEGRGRIRAILTPEQRPKFEEFVRRLDEERSKREQQHR